MSSNLSPADSPILNSSAPIPSAFNDHDMTCQLCYEQSPGILCNGCRPKLATLSLHKLRAGNDRNESCRACKSRNVSCHKGRIGQKCRDCLERNIQCSLTTCIKRPHASPNTACIGCFVNHRRCNRQQPCSRCILYGIECEYRKTVPQKLKKRQIDAATQCSFPALEFQLDSLAQQNQRVDCDSLQLYAPGIFPTFESRAAPRELKSSATEGLQMQHCHYDQNELQHLANTTQNFPKSSLPLSVCEPTIIWPEVCTVSNVGNSPVPSLSFGSSEISQDSVVESPSSQLERVQTPDLFTSLVSNYFSLQCPFPGGNPDTCQSIPGDAIEKEYQREWWEPSDMDHLTMGSNDPNLHYAITEEYFCV